MQVDRLAANHQRPSSLAQKLYIGQRLIQYTSEVLGAVIATLRSGLKVSPLYVALTHIPAAVGSQLTPVWKSVLTEHDRIGDRHGPTGTVFVSVVESGKPTSNRTVGCVTVPSVPSTIGDTCATRMTCRSLGPAEP